MPEGDTLHKIAGAMRPEAEGRDVVSVWLRDRGEIETLAGHRIEQVAAIGKHLLLSLAAHEKPLHRHVIHVHLGMRGRIHVYDPRQPRRGHRDEHLRVAIADRGWSVRRAARAEVLRGVDLAHHPVLSKLGPDLLAPAVDFDDVLRRARRREPRTITELLLDQRVACGIGNVYRCEVLFLEGLAPWAQAGHVKDEQIVRLYRRARTLLSHNLGGWRRTTIRRVDADHPVRPGETRYFVYGRAERPCMRCGHPIEVDRLGDDARVTFWCPRCQPSDSVRADVVGPAVRP